MNVYIKKVKMLYLIFNCIERISIQCIRVYRPNISIHVIDSIIDCGILPYIKDREVV